MKTNLNNYYAVIQLGYCVFGVGKTKKEAINDASEWLTGDAYIVDASEANDGDLVIVKCSELLYSEVKKAGGDILFYDDEDGIYCIDTIN